MRRVRATINPRKPKERGTCQGPHDEVGNGVRNTHQRAPLFNAPRKSNNRNPTAPQEAHSVHAQLRKYHERSRRQQAEEPANTTAQQHGARGNRGGARAPHNHSRLAEAPRSGPDAGPTATTNQVGNHQGCRGTNCNGNTGQTGRRTRSQLHRHGERGCSIVKACAICTHARRFKLAEA